MHTGRNGLSTPKTAEEISDEIIKLPLELKTDENDIIVPGITGRNDEHNEKGMRVSGLLKIKCSKYGLCFMNNCNISVKKYLNRIGLHLNYIGTITLPNNFLKAMNV